MRSEFFLKLRTKLRVGRDVGECDAPDERVDIKAGTAGNDGKLSAASNVCDSSRCRLAIVLRRVELLRVRYIKKVMPHASHLAFFDLSRADIEAAIYLPAIGGDDLAFECTGELDGQCALARRCRTDNDENSLFQVPEERLELSRVAPHDFESCAYTISPLRLRGKCTAILCGKQTFSTCYNFEL